jgi:hypothetical protein
VPVPGGVNSVWQTSPGAHTAVSTAHEAVQNGVGAPASDGGPIGTVAQTALAPQAPVAQLLEQMP